MFFYFIVSFDFFRERRTLDRVEHLLSEIEERIGSFLNTGKTLNLHCIGCSGHGKSSFANTIYCLLGDVHPFIVGNSNEPITKNLRIDTKLKNQYNIKWFENPGIPVNCQDIYKYALSVNGNIKANTDLETFKCSSDFSFFFKSVFEKTYYNMSNRADIVFCIQRVDEYLQHFSQQNGGNFNELSFRCNKNNECRGVAKQMLNIKKFQDIRRKLRNWNSGSRMRDPEFVLVLTMYDKVEDIEDNFNTYYSELGRLKRMNWGFSQTVSVILLFSIIFARHENWSNR